MSQTETKHLRERLFAFQTWMESQVLLGLMDLVKTPPCFDRSRILLKEIVPDKNIGQRCHFCQADFKTDESKTTDNHIMFFHHPCKEKFEKAEERALRYE